MREDIPFRILAGHVLPSTVLIENPFRRVHRLSVQNHSARNAEVKMPDIFLSFNIIKCLVRVNDIKLRGRKLRPFEKCAVMNVVFGQPIRRNQS